MGIQSQTVIELRQGSIGDPDFQLLQAFADALQVDVQDLLNRSSNRQEALDVYANALTNVAARANTRYKELGASLETLEEDVRTRNRERSDAQRQLRDAIEEKNFTLASELQADVIQKEKLFSEASLKEDQVESVLDTLNTLLTLFGERILAMQRNREALISGTQVTDMPGIDDLNIIERRTDNRRRNDETFDDVFETLRQEQQRPEESP